MDTEFKINYCAAVLLAAGASVRMGRPKQLLAYKGTSFLQNAVSAAKGANLSPIIVVLGSQSELIAKQMDKRKVHVVHNELWEEGISSSIRCGLHALEKIAPASDAVVLMVCDQPYVTSALLIDLLEAQKETMKPMIASSYSGVAGTPSLFHKSIFPDLLLLKGDRGASKILRKQTDRVTTIPFPMGAIDVDTGEDYKKLEQDIS